MKVTYKGEGGFISNRISFTPDIKDYDIPAEVGSYLLKTFPNFFDGIIEKIVVKEEEKIEEKPKATTAKKAK